MSLPPGRQPRPVAGINDQTDPELAKTAAELNAWVDYLLHPESNDGPRIYREISPQYPDQRDSEMPRRMENLDDDGRYETVSAIESFAGDPGAFFRAAEAVSGINEQMIHGTYDKLLHGVLTWDKDGSSQIPESERRAQARYPELHPARLNWMQMRKGWESPEDDAAHIFEEDFIRFQVYTENGFYIVAEYMARYRAIFIKAGENIKELMNALMARFARPHRYGDGGFEFNFLTIIVTGIVTAVSTVITGGAAAPTAAVVLSKVAVAMLGNAVTTAKEKGHETHLTLDNLVYLREIAQQYVDKVNRIEEDVEEAIKELYDNMRIELDQMRKEREYQAMPTDGDKKSMFVPHYRDYL